MHAAPDALPLPSALRPIGGSNLRAFPIAFGCWRFAGGDVRAAHAKIEAAVSLGVNLFDLADVYGLDHGGGGFGDAEALFGRVLAESPSLRGQILIATKGGIVPGVPYDSSARHIAASCEASLKRLRIEVIDLYQIHRPDLLAHPAQTADALVALRERGLVREVGVSNFTASQLEALQAQLPFAVATQQPELSCWRIDPLRDGTLDQCLRLGITPLAWSPLAGGRLALPPDAARREPDGGRLAALLGALDRLASREGVSRPAVALAWLLAHPAGIVPIVGTQRSDRLRACLEAMRVQLTRGDWYEVLAASQGHPHP
jgi:predicted oxidoreductase